MVIYRIPFFYRINFLTLAAKLSPSQNISEQVPLPPYSPTAASAFTRRARRGIPQLDRGCERGLAAPPASLPPQPSQPQTAAVPARRRQQLRAKPISPNGIQIFLFLSSPSLAPLTTLSRVPRLALASMPRRLREPPTSPTPPAPSSGAPPMGKTGPR